MKALSLTALGLILICPLPYWFIDLALCLSWASSIGFCVVFSQTVSLPLLKRVPAILMGLTIGRLCLNIATTRSILTYGQGGDLIKGVGHWIMGEQWVLGLMFFGTLVLIQFVVIAKGTERIAQVNARFALDALPGQQNALLLEIEKGLIHPEEGRYARDLLIARSDLCGAFDGVMRFVKGDALACLILIAVNGGGGVYLGTYEYGLTLEQSLNRYVLLMIGDGIWAQLPALFISITVGLLITRLPHTSSGDLDKSQWPIWTQKIKEAFFGAGLSCLVMSILPMWTLKIRCIFWGVSAGCMVGWGWIIQKRNQVLQNQGADYVISLHPDLYSHMSEKTLFEQNFHHFLSHLGLPTRRIHLQSNPSCSHSQFIIHTPDQTLTQGHIYPEYHFCLTSLPLPSSSSQLSQTSSNQINLSPSLDDLQDPNIQETQTAQKGGVHHLDPHSFTGHHPLWGIEGVWCKSTVSSLSPSLPADVKLQGDPLTPSTYLLLSLYRALILHPHTLWTTKEVEGHVLQQPSSIRLQLLKTHSTLLDLTQRCRAYTQHGYRVQNQEVFWEKLSHPSSSFHLSLTSSNEPFTFIQPPHEHRPYILIEGTLECFESPWDEEVWQKILSWLHQALMRSGCCWICVPSHALEKTLFLFHNRGIIIPIIGRNVQTRDLKMNLVGWIDLNLSE